MVLYMGVLLKVSNDGVSLGVKYKKFHTKFLSWMCRDGVVAEGLSSSIGVGQYACLAPIGEVFNFCIYAMPVHGCLCLPLDFRDAKVSLMEIYQELVM